MAAENEPHVSARPRKQGNFSGTAVYVDHIPGARVTIVGIAGRLPETLQWDLYRALISNWPATTGYMQYY